MTQGHITVDGRKQSYDINYDLHNSSNTSTPAGTNTVYVPASTPSSGLPWLDGLVGLSYARWISEFKCSGVCPHDSCIIGILRGLRQGIVYGAKVRFPHALVMTFLFRNGSITGKLRDIFNATYQHSWNLGRYVALFKLLECCLRHIRNKESGLNQVVAGFVAGAVMFGSNTPINSQINMYVYDVLYQLYYL